MNGPIVHFIKLSMYKKFRFLSLVLFFLPGFALASTSITTYSSITNTTRIGDVSSHTYQAQSFTATVTGSISTLQFYSGTSDGSPSDGLTVSLYTDSAGSPGTSLVSQTVPNSALGGNNLVTVTFSTPTSVVSGTSYWVVITRQGSVNGTNYYNWGIDCSNAYGGGLLKVGDVTPTWSVLNTGCDGALVISQDTMAPPPTVFEYLFGAVTTTASSTVSIVDNPTQDMFNILALFSLWFFGIYWVFSKKR